jgi:hypothetical protein
MSNSKGFQRGIRANLAVRPRNYVRRNVETNTPANSSIYETAKEKSYVNLIHLIILVFVNLRIFLVDA